MTELVLKVNGVNTYGWTTASIVKSMEQLSSTFDLTVAADKPPSPGLYNFKVGDLASIYLQSNKIIEGYIIDMPIDYDTVSHNLAVSGMDKTGDLVKCPHYDIRGFGQWRNQNTFQIIQDMVGKFGILVDNRVSNPGLKDLESFRVNEGETIFNVITRLCKQNNCLMLSDGIGNLILDRAGTTSILDVLELGRNVKRGGISQNNSERHSTYIVKGQNKSSDFRTFNDYISGSAIAVDSDVDRWRPLVIIADSKTDIQGMQNRANFEANQRAGQSRTLTYKTSGWFRQDKTPWEINRLVRVKDRFVGIDGVYLINSVNFTISEGLGFETHITLVHPITYQFPPAPEEVKTASDKATGQRQKLKSLTEYDPDKNP